MRASTSRYTCKTVVVQYGLWGPLPLLRCLHYPVCVLARVHCDFFEAFTSQSYHCQLNPASIMLCSPHKRAGATVCASEPVLVC